MRRRKSKTLTDPQSKTSSKLESQIAQSIVEEGGIWCHGSWAWHWQVRVDTIARREGQRPVAWERRAFGFSMEASAKIPFLLQPRLVPPHHGRHVCTKGAALRRTAGKLAAILQRVEPMGFDRAAAMCSVILFPGLVFGWIPGLGTQTGVMYCCQTPNKSTALFIDCLRLRLFD